MSYKLQNKILKNCKQMRTLFKLEKMIDKNFTIIYNSNSIIYQL